MQGRSHRYVCAACTLALTLLAAAPAVAWADDEAGGATNDGQAIETVLNKQDDSEISEAVPEANTPAVSESGLDDVTTAVVEEETPANAQEPTSDKTETVTPEEAPANEDSGTQTELPSEEKEPDTVVSEPATEDATTEGQVEDVANEGEAENVATEPDNKAEEIVSDATTKDSIAITAASAKTATSTEAPVVKAQAADDSSEKEDRPVADGVYVFDVALKHGMLISTAKNSARAGANVQLDADNGTYYQRWMVNYVADGYYTIVRRATTMALTVLGNKAAAGTNVQLAQNTKADGQLWKFVPMSNGYYQLVSKLRSNLVLDVAGAKSVNGTNIRVAVDSNGRGQQFRLYKANAAQRSTVYLDDATYTVRYAANTSYSIDIAGASRANGANVLLYRGNSAPRQKYRFISDGDGYYIITDIWSGKVLSTEDASVLPGNNIKQATYTGAAIQRWAVHKTANGYKIVNKSTGLSLALKNGVVANKSNIYGALNSNSSAQEFVIRRTRTLADGIYTINSFKNFKSVFNVKGNSAENYTPVQLRALDNTNLAQRFQVAYVGLVDGEEIYRIRTAASGGWLTYTKANGLMQYGNHSTKVRSTNTWKIVSNGAYFSLSNVLSGRVFNLRSGSTKDGTAIQASAADKSTNQHFYFVPTNLLPNGDYRILSALGTTTLAVRGSSKVSGANIQANGKTGSLGQVFTLKATGATNNTYYITNVNSGKVVTIAGSSTAAGGNVIQGRKTGAKSQQWNAQIADGGYVRFVNVNSGKVLAVVGNNKKAGANVRQNNALNVAGQKWKPVPTGWSLANGQYDYYDLSGKKTTWNSSSYTTWNRLKNKTSNTRYLVGVDKTNFRTNVYIKQSGQWVPVQSFRNAVGSIYSPSRDCDVLTTGHRGWYDLDEINGNCEYYVIEIVAPWAFNFHSIPFRGHTMNVMTARLGGRITGGCVRHSLKDSEWLWHHIRGGTRVVSF